MSTVRTVVHPGWIAVTGPGVDAVVAAADRHAPALEEAAQGGLLALLEALTAHGLSAAPDLVACAPTPTGLRVVVRGAGRAVLPDGTRVGSDGRMPWADLDVDVAEGAEVVLEAPEPEVPRGWRRPARLSRGTGERAPIDQLVTAGTPERAEIDQLVTAGTSEPESVPEPELEPEVAAEPEPEPESAPSPDRDNPDRDNPDRVNIDQLVDLDPAGGPAVEADAATEPEPEPAVDVEPEPVPVPVPAPQPDLTLPPPDDAVGLPPVARVPATPRPRSGLIDSVPWRRPGGESPARSADEAPPAPPAPSPTELLPVIEPDPQPAADAAAPDAVPPAAAAGTVEVPGPTQVMPPASEHVTPDVTTHRGSLPRSDDELDRPVVLAVLCPAGHPSPPHAGTCRTCGREIPPQQPFPTPRPSLGVLRISTGGSVPLDRGVLLGRAPRVNEELPANQRPHLLRVGGADRDISRNHAEVVLEGWHVLVRDLGSTNGTTVTLPGQEPVRLRPTEDQGIEPGTVVTLADEVELTYEVDG